MTHAREFDVEAGEGAEYMYSVRESTGIITLWTRTGWQSGYYVARFIPWVPAEWLDTKKKRIEIAVEEGQPVENSWLREKAEQHLKELISHASQS